MLGETYEYVCEDFRFLGEKVRHIPEQIVSFELEGKNYVLNSHNIPKPKFGFNGGKGSVSVIPHGVFDIYFKNLDEHISVSKPNIHVKNLIWGGLYVDIDGCVECINHKTKEKVKIYFTEKKDNKNSFLEGYGFDSQGNKTLLITGTWLSEIKMKDLRSGQTETVWEEGPLINEAHLQYFFNDLSVRLNQRVDGMDGVVSPTDSRWREDIKLYEEGEADEADKVKYDIEEEQRRKRRQHERENYTWEPNFFEEIEHPYVKAGQMNTNEDRPVMWRMK